MLLVVKNPPANAEDLGLINSWARKIPWRRKWQPTPVFLLGYSHRQRSLTDYSPWGPNSQTGLKQLSTHSFSICLQFPNWRHDRGPGWSLGNEYWGTLGSWGKMGNRDPGWYGA